MTTTIDLSRYAIPEEDRILLATTGVLSLAGSAMRGDLDVYGEAFAGRVYAALLSKALAGGFKEAAMLECYGKARSFTSRALRLGAEMVRCIGGHDAVLDICDLHAHHETTGKPS